MLSWIILPNISQYYNASLIDKPVRSLREQFSYKRVFGKNSLSI